MLFKAHQDKYFDCYTSLRCFSYKSVPNGMFLKTSTACHGVTIHLSPLYYSSHHLPWLPLAHLHNHPHLPAITLISSTLQKPTPHTGRCLVSARTHPGCGYSLPEIPTSVLISLSPILTVSSLLFSNSLYEENFSLFQYSTLSWCVGSMWGNGPVFICFIIIIVFLVVVYLHILTIHLCINIFSMLT